jgi:hypothetical protein
LAQKTNTSVWLFVFLTLSLLPRGDEFRMNSEGLDVFFSTYLLFSATFFRVRGELRREGAAWSVGPKKPPLAGFMGLAYGGAITRRVGIIRVGCTSDCNPDTLHKKPCRIGSGPCRTSEKAHKAKYFAQFTFYEHRGCRSELHTSRGRKSKVRIFEPSRGLDTPLSMPLKDPRFLCRSHTRYPQLLKAAFNALIADGLRVDGPGDLAEQTTAQTAFSYTSKSGRAGFLYQTGGVNS